MPKYLNLSFSGSTTPSYVNGFCKGETDLLLKWTTSDLAVFTVNPFFSAYLRSLFSIVCISPGSLVVNPRSSAYSMWDTLLLYHLVTLLLYHLVTLLLYHLVTLLLYHFNTLPLCYFTTLLLYHFVTLLLYHFVTLPHCYFTTLLLYHFVTLPPCYVTTLLLCYFTTLLLYAGWSSYAYQPNTCGCRLPPL